MSSDEDCRELPETRSRDALIWALGFYLVWTAATWLLEGRTETLLRPEATGLRIAYAVGVNILLAIGVGGWLIGRLVDRRAIAPGLVRPSTGVRTPLAVVAGLLLGGGLYALQGAPTWHPVVLTNAFAQVLVVSTAEVLVCWALVGNVLRESLGDRSPFLANLVGALLAALLFGLYHFAHSPPFNTWSMVGLLSVVGLLTGAYYFISRDIWGTVVFHNCLGVYGVVEALDKQEALASFQAPQPALFATATIALCALAALQYALRKR